MHVQMSHFALRSSNGLCIEKLLHTQKQAVERAQVVLIALGDLQTICKNGVGVVSAPTDSRSTQRASAHSSSPEVFAATQLYHQRQLALSQREQRPPQLAGCTRPAHMPACAAAGRHSSGCGHSNIWIGMDHAEGVVRRAGETAKQRLCWVIRLDAAQRSAMRTQNRQGIVRDKRQAHYQLEKCAKAIYRCRAWHTALSAAKMAASCRMCMSSSRSLQTRWNAWSPVSVFKILAPAAIVLCITCNSILLT